MNACVNARTPRKTATNARGRRLNEKKSSSTARKHRRVLRCREAQTPLTHNEFERETARRAAPPGSLVAARREPALH